MCGEDATGQGTQGQWGEIVGEPEHHDKDEVVFLLTGLAAVRSPPSPQSISDTEFFKSQAYWGLHIVR